jgi:hypothetical protein
MGLQYSIIRNDTHPILTFLTIVSTQVHGFFHNRNTFTSTSVTPTIYSVSDNILSVTPTPTPSSRSSLSHPHKFMGFFGQPKHPLSPSVTPTIYSVSDIISSFTPAPTHPHTPPYRIHKTSYTQVLWFLPSMTRSHSSDVTTRPVLDLLLSLPTQPSVCETFRSLRFNV